MSQFRKKPVVIEAMQLTAYPGDNAQEIADWCGGRSVWGASIDHEPQPNVLIDTLEGSMRAVVGDWIIKGTRGEFYPCKPGPFVDTFEPARVMTDAADRTLGESDEEALYRTAHALPATETPSGTSEGTTDAGKDQGAREARYAEAMEAAAIEGVDWADLARAAVLPLVDAEVAAAVSEAQAEVGRLRGIRREVEANLRQANVWSWELKERAESAEEWQNEIAERIPDSYDCDDAQEAIIARWLDDLTSGDPQRVAQATAEGEGS